MKTQHVVAFIVPLLLCGCGRGVDVGSMLRDFDRYEKDLQALATGDDALKTLQAGREKRDEAGALVDRGKDAAAVPIAEQALADARLALDIEQMNAAARRAEKCRLEVEEARTKWREAVFVLEQTEEFVGKKAPVSRRAPETPSDSATLPPSILASVIGDCCTR